ncbi:MAG TPA: CheR family methyltransferase, partial [Planctomycetaceae bacterium]|nr:CheR family methyltransferase [Planctomycetaceae bacterium]
AILLKEEGLYSRCRIYGTDMNEAVLSKCREGVFPLASMKEYTQNYNQAGGQRPFSEYYTACYDNAVLKPSLRDNVVFAQHNLVTDRSFNEFQVIFVRNVMIYFNRSLQDSVHRLVLDSLCPTGFLALGTKESLHFAPCRAHYEELDACHKIYRRKRLPCVRLS